MDKEFGEESRRLFQMAIEGQICLLISGLLTDELAFAPEEVQNLLKSLPENVIESLVVSDEALELRDAYIKQGVSTRIHGNDALHVALATVARADMIVSWNFKHIVHFDKIRGFNSVNLREGYLPIEIHSPKEVV